MMMQLHRLPQIFHRIEKCAGTIRILRAANVPSSSPRLSNTRCCGSHAKLNESEGWETNQTSVPVSPPSSWGAELVTRTVLQATATAAAAGIPPSGVSELISPSPSSASIDKSPSYFTSLVSSSGSTTAPGQGELEGPTCRRCTIRALSGDTAEALSDLLLGQGAQSVVVSEHRPLGRPEQQIYDDGSTSGTPLWDLCDVDAHFVLEDDPMTAIQAAAEALLEAGYSLPEPSPGNDSPDAQTRPSLLAYEVEEVANEAWVDQIKASYVPISISPHLYIVPEWSEPEAQGPGIVNVILQPGVAFGTGEHPTTRLCLLALEAMALKGKTIIDYGTGSGVLALAALHMGAASAVGTDTDGLAVRAARRNAALNGLAERFAVLQCGAGVDDPEPLEQAGMPSGLLFDVVAANILRGPLVELRNRLAGYGGPGSALLLSGILTEQAPEVIKAYREEGYTDFVVQSDGSWACVQARKR